MSSRWPMGGKGAGQLRYELYFKVVERPERLRDVPQVTCSRGVVGLPAPLLTPDPMPCVVQTHQIVDGFGLSGLKRMRRQLMQVGSTMTMRM